MYIDMVLAEVVSYCTIFLYLQYVSLASDYPKASYRRTDLDVSSNFSMFNVTSTACYIWVSPVDVTYQFLMED